MLGMLYRELRGTQYAMTKNIRKVADQYNSTLQKFVDVNARLATKPKAPTGQNSKLSSKPVPKE